MKIDERELFKRVMTDFILEEDPMLAMLKWMTEQLMEVEAANKNEHSDERKTHFSGYRPRIKRALKGIKGKRGGKRGQARLISIFVTLFTLQCVKSIQKKV